MKRPSLPTCSKCEQLLRDAQKLQARLKQLEQQLRDSQQLIRELTAFGIEGVEALAGAVVDPLWQQLSDFALWPAARATLKANMPPSRLAAFCLANESLAVHAHAGSGIVRAHVTDDLTEARQAGKLARGETRVLSKSALQLALTFLRG